jgi:hypothetical protein
VNTTPCGAPIRPPRNPVAEPLMLLGQLPLRATSLIARVMARRSYWSCGSQCVSETTKNVTLAGGGGGGGGGGPSTGTGLNFCATVSLQVHSWMLARSAPLAALTSMHLPLFGFRMTTRPSPVSSSWKSCAPVPLQVQS